jgi:hypothetical protein
MEKIHIPFETKFSNLPVVVSIAYEQRFPVQKDILHDAEVLALIACGIASDNYKLNVSKKAYETVVRLRDALNTWSLHVRKERELPLYDRAYAYTGLVHLLVHRSEAHANLRYRTEDALFEKEGLRLRA